MHLKIPSKLLFRQKDKGKQQSPDLATQPENPAQAGSEIQSSIRWYEVASQPTGASAYPQQQLADQLNSNQDAFRRPSVTRFDVHQPSSFDNQSRPTGPVATYAHELYSDPATVTEQPGSLPRSAINNGIDISTASRHKVTVNDPGRTFEHRPSPNNHVSPLTSPSSPGPPQSRPEPVGSASQGAFTSPETSQGASTPPYGNTYAPWAPEQPQEDGFRAGIALSVGDGPGSSTQDGMSGSGKPGREAVAAALAATQGHAPSAHPSYAKAFQPQKGDDVPIAGTRGTKVPRPRQQQHVQTPGMHLSRPAPERQEHTFLEGPDYSGDEHDIAETPLSPMNGAVQLHNSASSEPSRSNTETRSTQDDQDVSKAKQNIFSRKLLSRQTKETLPNDAENEAKDEKKTEKRAKEALRPFKQDRKPGLTYLDTLFAWFPEELRKRENDCMKANNEAIRMRKILNENVKKIDNLGKQVVTTQELHRTIADLQGQNADLKCDLTAQRKDRDFFRKENEVIRQQLAAAQGQIQRSNSDAVQLNIQLQSAKDAAQRCMERNRGLDTEVRNLDGKVRSLETEKNNLSNQLASETRRLEQEKLHETGNLANRLASETHRLEQEKRQEVVRLTALLASETERLEQEKANETYALTQRLKANETEHETAVATLQVTLKDAESRHRREKSKLEKSIDTRIAQETRHLSGMVKTLNNAIAAHTKDSWRPIPDDQLRLSFQKIVQKVSNLVGFIPKPSTPDFTGNGHQSYDDTGFFARGVSGTRAWPRFIKTLCWSVYFTGFFQLQPGFGILGSSGEGSQMMHAVYDLLAVERAGEGQFCRSHTMPMSIS